jgi:hypothetical protein
MQWPHFIALTQFFIVQSDWSIGFDNLESEFHEAGTPSGIESTYHFIGLADSMNEGPAKKGTELLLSIMSGFQIPSERLYGFVLYTVHRMRGRAATVPADHVYAPLSLVSKFKTETDSLPPVNYALSVLEIYTKPSSSSRNYSWAARLSRN